MIIILFVIAIPVLFALMLIIPGDKGICTELFEQLEFELELIKDLNYNKQNKRFKLKNVSYDDQKELDKVLLKIEKEKGILQFLNGGENFESNFTQSNFGTKNING